MVMFSLKKSDKALGSILAAVSFMGARDPTPGEISNLSRKSVPAAKYPKTFAKPRQLATLCRIATNIYANCFLTIFAWLTQRVIQYHTEVVQN